MSSRNVYPHPEYLTLPETAISVPLLVSDRSSAQVRHRAAFYFPAVLPDQEHGYRQYTSFVLIMVKFQNVDNGNDMADSLTIENRISKIRQAGNPISRWIITAKWRLLKVGKKSSSWKTLLPCLQWSWKKLPTSSIILVRLSQPPPQSKLEEYAFCIWHSFMVMTSLPLSILLHWTVGDPDRKMPRNHNIFRTNDHTLHKTRAGTRCRTAIGTGDQASGGFQGFQERWRLIRRKSLTNPVPVHTSLSTFYKRYRTVL